MEDEKIIDLFWNRDESAIAETSSKYGRLCFYIANKILSSREDCEEVVNDTYMSLWNCIPTNHPNRLSVFIGKITRNLALKKYEYNSAAKRNSEASCSIDELEDIVSGGNYVENEFENKRIELAIDQFLLTQDPYKRYVFIRRYWYFDSIDEISGRTGFSESKIKSMLFHLRKGLKEYLEKEGINI